MAGINRYYSQIKLANATSLNESAARDLLQKSASVLAPSSPCVFLSHKSEDKEAVKKIGEYIKSKGIDIYLDVDDANLQRAVRENDHAAITRFIEIGIRSSSDLMTIVSEKTRLSWWVPYEIGFGKSAAKYVCSMRLKNVSLPSFLSVTRQIKGTASLDKYLGEVRKRDTSSSSYNRVIDQLLSENGLYKQGGVHPLTSYLEAGI